MRWKLSNIQTDLLKRHIGPFIFCFLTLMFVLLMQFLILHIDKLVGKGIPFHVIVELIATNLAYMVVLAGPMSVLVATLMAYGKFSELNEWAAVNAAGVHPMRMINPLIGAAAVLCLFLMWFANDVLPEANQRARSLFIDIRVKKPGFDLQPNVFYEGIDGYTFLVKRMSAEGDSLFDVTLYQEARGNRNKAVIRADRGQLVSSTEQILTLYLQEGTIFREIPQAKRRTMVLEHSAFDRYRISFDLSELAFNRSDPNRRRRSDRTMSAQAMMAVVDSLENEMDEERRRYAKKANIELLQSIGMRMPEQPKPESDPIVADTGGPNQALTPDTGTTELRLNSEQQQLKLRYPAPDSLRMAFDSMMTFYTDEKRDTIAAARTPYVMINQMKTWNQQERLMNTALRGLRDARAQIENTGVNIKWRKTRASRFLVEVHKKFAIPFSAIIFVLIGAPIGLMSRNGNLGVAALISAGLLTFNWIAIIQGEKLADRLFISPWLGMWFSNIVLGTIGVILLFRICSRKRPIRKRLREVVHEED
jgi:lipopolysaccharide export system permease protein